MPHSHSILYRKDPPSSSARTPALESCHRQFLLQYTSTNPFVFPVSPSILCRGLSFRTPQLGTDLAYALHGRFRVASTIFHVFRLVLH